MPRPDSDPEDVGKAIQEAVEEATATTGLRKLCVRRHRCARKMTCEHAQVRNQSSDVVDLFRGKSPDLGDCENWKARRELNTELDIIRRPNGSGSRHNAHADREAARKELIRKIDAGEPIPFSNHTPEELKNMLDNARRKKGK